MYAIKLKTCMDEFPTLNRCIHFSVSRNSWKRAFFRHNLSGFSACWRLSNFQGPHTALH